MSVYNTVSSNRLIGKIYRDFKPSNSAWIPDAIEWIGEALEIMKIHQGFKKETKEYSYTDHRFKIPCGLIILDGVEVDNRRVPRSGRINATDFCSCSDNYVCETDEGYVLNPGYIFLPCIEGCVKIHGKWIDTDCDGFPMILDVPEVMIALEWYVMMYMCLRGFKHQTIDFPTCERMWEKYYPRAKNACRLPDIDDYELFKKSWLGIAKSTNLTNEFFNTAYVGQSNVNDALPPGSLTTNSLTIIR